MEKSKWAFAVNLFILTWFLNFILFAAAMLSTSVDDNPFIVGSSVFILTAKDKADDCNVVAGWPFTCMQLNYGEDGRSFDYRYPIGLRAFRDGKLLRLHLVPASLNIVVLLIYSFSFTMLLRRIARLRDHTLAARDLLFFLTLIGIRLATQREQLNNLSYDRKVLDIEAIENYLFLELSIVVGLCPYILTFLIFFREESKNRFSTIVDAPPQNPTEKVDR